MPPETSIDPRLRALYLLAIAVGVFFLPAWWMVAIATGAQLALWLALGLGIRALGRQLRKLFLFLAVIQVAYALVTVDPGHDVWRTVSVFGLDIDVNEYGALVGLTMVLRVLAVVLASQVVRAGDPRALASGLGRLGIPRVAALSIDATLTLLGDRGKRHGDGGGGGRGGRGGGGGGGGRGRGDGSGKSAGGFRAGLRRLARGDVGLIADRLRSHVDRVESHVVENGADPRTARDVAVIAGIALTMLGIKMLKLLPGLPFAPGHKGVILIPLYVVAGFMTRGRAGATLTGLTMGTVAFLLGDGRWGVFEIAKHVAPGVLVDLMMPLMRRTRGRGFLAWSAFGTVIALGRFATITAIALTVQAPALVYAFLIPGLVVHAVFGILSGIVTAPLLRALDRSLDKPAHPPAEAGTTPPTDKKHPREAA